MPRKTNPKPFPKGYVSPTTLGSGGMAVVYKARQKNLDRDVAIKVLLPEYARDTGVRQRFEREARYAAALQHESIVPIYDFVKEGGASFMVMEFVDGIDLRKIIMALGALPPQVAGLIALRVLRALEHAHRRGIVHRDIKPGNVLISKRGEVKITDFGIAKDPSNPEDDLTRTGTALGTPLYMSPEQVLGEDLDFSSDLFSFGVVFYEMLTGERPFKGDTEGKLMKAISDGTYKDVRRVGKRVQWALARVVRRCLKVDKRKRFKSTEAARRRLQKFVYRRIPGSGEEHLAEYLERSGLFVEGTQVVENAATELAGGESRAPEWTVPPPLAWRARFVWGMLAALPALVLFMWPSLAGRQVPAETPTATPTEVSTPMEEVTPTPEPTHSSGDAE